MITLLNIKYVKLPNEISILYTKNSYYLCVLSFLMIKLWNNMILDEKTAKNTKIHFCQKLTYMYIMYISTVLPVLKIYKTLPA